MTVVSRLGRCMALAMVCAWGCNGGPVRRPLSEARLYAVQAEGVSLVEFDHRLL